MSCLKIIQLNLHRSQQAANLLGVQLDKGDIGICLIQEPYVYKRRVRGLSNAGNIIEIVSDERQRACVWVRKDLNTFLLKQFSCRDIVTIELKYKMNGTDKKVIISSHYCDIDLEIPSTKLSQLIEHCISNNKSILLGCDANSHHLAWGSKDSNPRGEKLYEFLVASDLRLLNRGSRPTFFNRVSETIIDITFCSPDLENYISNWTVSQEVTLSDHKKIEFDLSADRTPMIPFRNPRKTDWSKFGEELSQQMDTWRVSNGKSAID